MNKIHAIAISLLISVSLQAKVSDMKNNYANYSYEDMQAAFTEHDAWGLHTTIDLKDCDPELIRSAEAIELYIITLCDLIEMKRFGDPVIVHFGEDEKVAGFSMTQLIETSLVSGHFANATNAIYIDVFSCKLYNPHTVAQFTKEFFKGDAYTINVLLRK